MGVFPWSQKQQKGSVRTENALHLRLRKCVCWAGISCGEVLSSFSLLDWLQAYAKTLNTKLVDEDLV